MTKTKAKKAADEAAEAAMDEAGEGIDQVRDILFGAQMRTVDRRLAQLEGRFQRDLEAVRKDLSKQLSDLGKQGDAFTEKLTAERAKRTEELKMLRSDMNKGLKALDRSVAKIDDATSKADAESRDQILALGQSLTKDIKALSGRLEADIDRYTTELRSEKTDIASLVELYTDMARRLAAILETPGGK